MKIGIATDHRGIIKKQQIIDFLNQSENYEVINFGTDTEKSVDYPIYAFQIGEAIRDKKIDFGILLCATGIGMSIACNKVKGVRCAKVDNKEEAKLTRIDNNSNVIALNSNKNIDELIKLIELFIQQPFSNEERHIRRIEMIDHYEC